MNRITTIKQFREKYGAYALSLEEDFTLLVDENLNALKTDFEIQQLEYFYLSNQEYFFQFVDYLSAIGKYDEMFFVVTPSAQYYAYSERGRQNIIKHLSKFADDFQSRADKLRSIVKEASLTNSRIVGVMVMDSYPKTDKKNFRLMDKIPKINERNNYSSAELSRLLQMSKKSIDGLSYAIQTSVEIDPRNNYGKLSFEYVLMLLKLISDKMQDEQTVQDFLG